MSPRVCGPRPVWRGALRGHGRVPCATDCSVFVESGGASTLRVSAGAGLLVEHSILWHEILSMERSSAMSVTLVVLTGSRSLIRGRRATLKHYQFSDPLPGYSLDDLFRSLGDALCITRGSRTAASADSSEIAVRVHGSIGAPSVHRGCTEEDRACTSEIQQGVHALHAGLQGGGNQTPCGQRDAAKLTDPTSLHSQIGGAPGDHFQWEGDSKIVRRPRTMLVFVNPASGKRRGMRVWEVVEVLFRAANIHLRVVVTRCKGHAFDVVSDDREVYDGIVAVGGDGTFNEVLSGLLARRRREGGQDDGAACCQQQPTLGIISAGSDCALAKFVSHLDPSLAAQDIINNQFRPLDVLRIGFRRFPGDDEQVRHSVCAVAWGIPGQVASESESLRERWGTYRYALSVVKNIVRLKPVKGSIRVSRATSSNSEFGTADQQEQALPADELLEGEFLVAGVFKCAAGSIMSSSHPSDGCTDVVAITARSRVSLASLVLRAMCMHCIRPGSHLQLKELHFCKAREVIITPTSPQDTLNIDGEVGEATQTHISILPSAITIFSRVP